MQVTMTGTVTKKRLLSGKNGDFCILTVFDTVETHEVACTTATGKAAEIGKSINLCVDVQAKNWNLSCREVGLS